MCQQKIYIFKKKLNFFLFVHNQTIYFNSFFCTIIIEFIYKKKHNQEKNFLLKK